VNNYSLLDAAAIASAFLLFIPLVFFPGYLLGRFFNLFQFRTQTPAFQIAISLTLSISVGPLLTFLVGLLTGWRFVWLLYLTAAYPFLSSRFPITDKSLRRPVLVAVGWFTFATIWLMDWQFQSRLYFPVYAFDYATRAAFVHSIAAFGLPAENPLFYPGHPVALHYHFLWLLQCALVHWIAPAFITARIALIAGAIWCGLGLMSIAALITRSWIAIVLLTVTGIDLLLTIFQLPPNTLHLQAMLHAALAQPHYICAIIACFTGFLLLRESHSPVIAALCFATAVGAGSFVALVFAAFLATWLLWKRSRALAIAGVLTVLFSLPYLQTLRGPSQNVESQPLVSPTVLAFSAAQLSPMLNFILLPVNYFLEFGLFAIGSFRRKPKPIFVVMAAVSIVICTFLKSGATPNNDLGWRGLLVAQFALLILASDHRPTRVYKALLVLGLLGTTYDLLLNRLFPILADLHQGQKPVWMAADQLLGKRTLANRDAYNWLQHHSSQTTTIAQNPNVSSVDIFSGLYADRRILAGDSTCTIGFGGTASECAPLESRLAQLFMGQADFPQTCSALAADFYTVKDTDAVWHQSKSWAWTQQPLFANQFVRIFECPRSNR